MVMARVITVGAPPADHGARRSHSPTVRTQENVMSDLSRRAFLGTAAAAAVTLSAPAVHAQKRGGTLRFVPHADLKILDPIWTTAYITRNHGYLVYDTLFATDANLKVQPQMVDKWSMSANKMR